MSDPTPIRDLLQGVLARLGVARPLEVAELLARWEEVAGEPWAARAAPVSLSGGELVVEAADGSTASLLRYQTAQLIARLDEEVGRGLVTSVRVRVRRRDR